MVGEARRDLRYLAVLEVALAFGRARDLPERRLRSEVANKDDGGSMRAARILIAVLLVAMFGLMTAVQALAIRDPFIVCVREPCGPQLPKLPPLPL